MVLFFCNGLPLKRGSHFYFIGLCFNCVCIWCVFYLLIGVNIDFLFVNIILINNVNIFCDKIRYHHMVLLID